MSRRSSRTAARAVAVQSALDVSGVTSVTLVLEEQYHLAVGALSGCDLGGSDVSGQPAGRIIRLLVDADGSLHVPRAPTDFYLFQFESQQKEVEHASNVRKYELIVDYTPSELFSLANVSNYS